MKKILKLYILTVLFILNNTYTTKASSLPLRFGPKLGVGTAITIANKEFTDKEFSSNPLVLAFGGGVFVDYKISDLFMVGASLNYEMGGTKIKNNDKEQLVKKVTKKYTDHSFIIPITAGVTPIEGLSICAGPEVQLLISSKFSGTGIDGKELSSEQLKDTQEAINKSKRLFDIGLRVVIDYDILNTGFLVGVKYSFGFIGKIQKPKDVEGEYNKPQRRTMTPMFIIGYDVSKLL